MGLRLSNVWGIIFNKESLETGGGYINSLSRSMCLAIEEFYKDINVKVYNKMVSVSSINGNGFG